MRFVRLKNVLKPFLIRLRLLTTRVIGLKFLRAQARDVRRNFKTFIKPYTRQLRVRLIIEENLIDW